MIFSLSTFLCIYIYSLSLPSSSLIRFSRFVYFHLYSLSLPSFSAKMMWESIPGAVLQTYAIISRFEGREWVQIVSLFASALAVGAISSRMSYYLDIGVNLRSMNGHFYGYVPDSMRGRSFILVAMMMMSSSQLLARALAYSLIAVRFGNKYAILAVVLEVCVFFLYKLARRDFYYHNLAKVKGVMRVVTSFYVRLLGKIIADFTSFMHAR
jgi:hypothetical protein